MAISKSLNALAGAAPSLNKKSKQRAQGQRQMGLQAAIGGSERVGAAGTSAAAAGQISQGAQINQQAQAALTQEQGQLGQMALTQTATKQQAEMTRRQEGQRQELTARQQKLQMEEQRKNLKARKTVTDNERQQAERLQRYGIEQDNRLLTIDTNMRKDLANLGNDVRQKTFDSRLRFERDEMGRKFTNERQLMDYKVANMKSKIELQDFSQQMTQAYKRKSQLMTITISKLQEALERGYLSEKQQLDAEASQKLQEMVWQMEDQLRKDKAKANNTSMILKGVGAVAGGIIGGYFTGGLGAAGGAAVGEAIGEGVAGAATGGV
jgi:hypothetical protein